MSSPLAIRRASCMNPAAMSEANTEATAIPPTMGMTRADFMELTKFRLSLLVLISTFVSYWLNRPAQWTFAPMMHTMIGSALAAFGAAIFNQLMEIGPDSLMKRTADRPLPARRVEPGVAFGMGWLLSAFALIHLVKMVNLESAALCALTLGVYIFIYTPMKQKSAWNTIVGAVSGALPPLIGWAGAAGAARVGDPYFRTELVLAPGAVYLFLLLFLWQLPHFLAINWMYRDEYRKGGFVMWANEDESGQTTSRLALIFSVAALLLTIHPVMTHCVSAGFAPASIAINAVLISFAWRFFKARDRASARKLFLFTLLHLPLMLAAAAIFWNRA